MRLGLLLTGVLDRKESLLDFVILGHLLLGRVLQLTDSQLCLGELSREFATLGIG